MYKIIVIGFNNCSASSVGHFLDTMKMANQVWRETQRTLKPLFTWKLVSESLQPIQSASGMFMLPDALLMPDEEADLIFIPSVWYKNKTQLLKDSLRINNWLGEVLIKMYRNGALIASKATGAFVIAATGIAEGKNVTTNLWLSDFFTNQFPDVNVITDQLIVEDQRIITTGSFCANIMLELQLIEMLAGAYIAGLTSKYIYYDSVRSLKTPNLNILRSTLEVGDEIIQRAQIWMRANLHRSFETCEVAQAVHLSYRTFSRRFKQVVKMTPLKYLQELRIELAKRLLETTSLSAVQIMERVGYTDINSFRKLFKAKTGCSFSEYRMRIKDPLKYEVIEFF